MPRKNITAHITEWVYYGDGAYYGANKTLVAANDDYVYELRQNVLKKYDIETGASTLYESQYTFKGLKFNKKLNQVKN